MPDPESNASFLAGLRLVSRDGPGHRVRQGPPICTDRTASRSLAGPDQESGPKASGMRGWPRPVSRRDEQTANLRQPGPRLRTHQVLRLRTTRSQCQRLAKNPAPPRQKTRSGLGLLLFSMPRSTADSQDTSSQAVAGRGAGPHPAAGRQARRGGGMAQNTIPQEASAAAPPSGAKQASRD